MAQAHSTIAVGLTDNNGNFKINPDVTFQPQVGSTYILEARKRLGGEGNSVLTLKTFIKWTVNGWTSITGGNVYINTKTTALAIISGYNSNLLNPDQTIGKLNIVNGLVVAGDITNSFKAQDLINAENVVILALNNDQDPTEKIKYNNNALVFPQNSPTPTATPTNSTSGGSGGGGSSVDGSISIVNFPIIYNASKVTQSGISGIEEDNFAISGSYLSNSSVIIEFLIDSKSVSRTITPVSNDVNNLLFTVPRLTDNEIRYLYNLPSGGDVSNINRTAINISFTVHNGNGPSRYINFNDGSANPVPSPTPTPLPTATPVSTPTPLPSPTPVPIPSNYSYSIVSTGYLKYPSAIDVKDDRIYVGDYDRSDPSIPSGRLTIMDLSGNIIKKIKMGSSSYLLPPLESIVVVDRQIWAVSSLYDNNDLNFFSFSIDGTPIQNAKIPVSSNFLQDLAVDPENKAIYFTDSFPKKALLKLNYDSNFTLDTPEMPLNFIDSLYTYVVTTDKDANVYGNDSLVGTINKFNKDGIKIMSFSITGKNDTSQYSPLIKDIAINPNNSDIYLLSLNSELEILRYDKEGHFIKAYAKGLIDGTYGFSRKMSVGSDGSIYVTDYSKGQIIKINILD